MPLVFVSPLEGDKNVKFTVYLFIYSTIINSVSLLGPRSYVGHVNRVVQSKRFISLSDSVAEQ